MYKYEEVIGGSKEVHRRVEDNWDMRVDDPLCVALAPAALQM